MKATGVGGRLVPLCGHCRAHIRGDVKADQSQRSRGKGKLMGILRRTPCVEVICSH